MNTKRPVLARIVTSVLMAIILVGCGTLYKTAVTLSEAENAVMKEWSTLHNDGKTSPDLDRKVMDAHDKFNQLKQTAAVALRAYAAGADKEDYVVALEAARQAIGPILDLIMPLISGNKLQSLSLKVAEAKTP